jgi:hypothetical protein
VTENKENNESKPQIDSKPYSIIFEDRIEYLYVYVSGEHDSYEISRAYWLEVAEHCRRTGCKRVLIEEDIAEVVSMTDMFRLANDLPQMGFLGVRVAFFDRYAEHNELNEFGELVAVNRGLYGKIFNEIDKAKEWLLSD